MLLTPAMLKIELQPMGIKMASKQRSKPSQVRRANTTKMVGHKVPIAAAQLRAIPEDERTLLVGTLLATNEINGLRKLVLLANRTNARNEVERAARTFHELMLLRMFATKVYEAYNFFKKASKFKTFGSDYIHSANLPDQGSALKEAKDKLGGYFGDTNMLNRLRNGLGAHYDMRSLHLDPSDIDEIDSFIFIADQGGNSLYFVSEEIAAKRLARDANLPLKEVIGKLIDDINEMAVAFVDLAMCVSIICLSRHVGSAHMQGSPSTTVSLTKASDAELPFFVDFRPTSARRPKHVKK